MEEDRKRRGGEEEGRRGEWEGRRGRGRGVEGEKEERIEGEIEEDQGGREKGSKKQ